MSELNFKYCPVCGEKLETGKIKFPTPHSILDIVNAPGKYYSDKTLKEYKGHPIKKLFKTYDYGSR